MNFKFSAELWLYPGEGAWVFTTLPHAIAKAIKGLTGDMPKKGFGAIKVLAEVNGIQWHTSIFPDAKTASYLLPVKKDIRKKASLSVGNAYSFTLQLKEVH